MLATTGSDDLAVGVTTVTASRRSVGIPIHERLLTDRFLELSSAVIRPGRGRTLYVIEEPELGGSGRPDLVFVTMQSNALAKYRRSGLHIPSAAAARALDPSFSGSRIGISPSYGATVRRGAAARGWGDVDSERIAALLVDTLAVEAKMRDWRRALQQVSRFRRHFHRSAVLMPQREMPAASGRSLDFYGCGLLLQSQRHIEWARPAKPGNPAIASRLWLLELLVRGLDNGTAYRLSDFRKRSNASR